PQEQRLTPPEESPLVTCSPTLSEPLPEDEVWLAMFQPLQEYNAATPWPTNFHEQSLSHPAWHADCPEGYAPTTLAGYPVSRQFPLYVPAAHDPDIALDENGHYCLDLIAWDQCCMGKCDETLIHEAMETLTVSTRPDLSIPVPGVSKNFEMHPSGPSVNPATRMPPPPSTTQDGQDRSHTREQVQQSSQTEDSVSSTQSLSDKQSQSTVPVVPQEHEQNDASQSSSQVRTPEDASQSQTSSINSPTRHKRTASGLLKAVDTPNDQRPRAESVSSAGSKAGEVAAQLKTRLAYAMVKVQHGWEHRNINEVEQLAAALNPRMAASPPASSAPIDIRSPPSKRRSGAGMVTWSLPDTSPGSNGLSQNSRIFRRSMKPLSRPHPDSPTGLERSPKRPIILSRNNSSTSEVSLANSEVREARERVLEEVEEAA
ncbi:unnamed protein product, partial [Aureobasidium uvarum]